MSHRRPLPNCAYMPRNTGTCWLIWASRKITGFSGKLDSCAAEGVAFFSSDRQSDIKALVGLPPLVECAPSGRGGLVVCRTPGKRV